MGYNRPDVYIEEILTPEIAPNGVSTSIAAFLGFAQRGPANQPIFIDSFSAFKRTFGEAVENESLYYSVRSFFENGGAACYIVRMIDVSATEGGAPTLVAANTSIDNQASVDILKFSAGFRGLPSYGEWGKDLIVKPRKNSSFVNTAVTTDAAVGDTTLSVGSTNGLIKGDIIKVTEQNNTEHFFKVSGVSSVVQTGVIVRQVEVSTPLTATITAAGSTLELLSYDLTIELDGEELETFTRLTMNPESDRYFETVINDEQVGSRYVLVEDLEVGNLISADREILTLALLSSYALTSDGQDEKANFDLQADLIDSALPSISAKKAINLLCIPPSIDAVNGKLPATDIPVLHAAMLEFCGNRMDMFAILDAPAGLTASTDAVGSVGEYRSTTLGIDTYWGALYYPSVKMPKVIGGSQLVTVPPSGSIAGLYSRVDSIPAPRGGISTSPAGHDDFGQLRGLSGLSLDISDSAHGDLNIMGVNCLRVVDQATGLPSVNVLGARTLSSTLDFRYINVRRMMTFIEKNVKNIGERSLFRNNSPILWSQLTAEISSFLTKRFESGELAGNTKSESFFVKIDSETNTAENIRQGILVGEIGVALLRPAEFIIFRFSQIQSN